MAMQFDVAELAVKILAPNNKLIYDDKGLPSVMVEIPKLKIKDLIDGGPDIVHPAFKVNGVEKDSIFISKYQNVVNNGRAYSLPGMDPKTSINFDTAAAACSAKGTGWHLMTAAEWALILLICKKNNFLPWGNNSYGKDSRETLYKAIPAMYDNQNRVNRVLTGTGPITWSHNGAIDGIWDLNGNVSEWLGGRRFVYGELQVLADNNAADPDNSQAAASSEWKAIDAQSGDLITPDGLGTTPGSIKLNFTNSKLFYTTTAITDGAQRNCLFKDIYCDDTIGEDAQLLLKTLALIPDDPTFDYEGDRHYIDNSQAERLSYGGGYWYYGATSGVFCSVSGIGRSTAGGYLGFRSAYCELND